MTNNYVVDTNSDKKQNINEVINILLNMNGYISGSYILKKITNTFSNNDIDVYILDNDFDYSTLENYTKLNNLALTQSKIIYKKHISDIYKIKNLSIDVIIVNSNHNKSIFDFIVHYFDMDILKNYYNNGQYYVHNITSIINKKTIMDQIVYLSLSRIANRLHKYTKRGFNITLSDEMETRLINKYVTGIHNTFNRLTYSTYLVHIYDGCMLYNDTLYLQEINSEIIFTINKNDKLFSDIIDNLYFVYKGDNITLYTGTKSISIGVY
jgi:hypothetical protein